MIGPFTCGPRMFVLVVSHHFHLPLLHAAQEAKALKLHGQEIANGVEPRRRFSANAQWMRRLQYPPATPPQAVICAIRTLDTNVRNQPQARH